MTAPWMESALCRQVGNPDWWFPAKGGGAREARKVCAACPVQAECLQYALDHGADGIWGGTSARERRRLGGSITVSADVYLRPCGTEAAQQRHRRAGESCAVCGVAA